MDDITIFKTLKRHYNEVKSKGYNPLFICLQGSQNYKLDNEDSDIDSIVALIPSEEDIISGNRISTTIITDNNEHIDIKDIRDLISLWIKGNNQFLQILFTDYKIINKHYREYVNYYFDNGEQITRANRMNLFKSIDGMSKQDYMSYNDVRLDHLYDGKRMYHLLRLNQLANNLIKGMNYKEAMQTYDPEVLIMINKLRNYEYDVIKVQQLANMYYENTRSLIDRYLFNKSLEDKTQLVMNEKIIEEIKDNTLLLMRKIYLDQVLVNQPRINLDNFKDVYVTSDLHFGHKNILDFENRREKMRVETIEEHDKKLIDNWNSAVKKDDLVLILGDFSFHNAKETMNILKQLKGIKILIEGNHDCIYLKDKSFNKALFAEIADYREMNYHGINLCLMHYPILCFKHIDKDINPYIHLFGHIHTNVYDLPRHSYNVGADVNNFTPIHISRAIELALKNN